MKIIFTTVLALTLSITTFAQNKPDGLEITIGEEIKLKNKELIDGIIGVYDGDTYVMATNGDEMTIMVYDENLKMDRKNLVKLKFEKHDLVGPTIYQRGDDFVMLTRYKDKKKKVDFLYIQTMNKNTLTFSKPVTLGEVSYEGYKKSESGYFASLLSKNGEHLMIKQYPASRRGENYSYEIAIYDMQMEEEWGMSGIEVELEKKSGSYLYQSQLGDDGAYYMLRKFYDRSKKYERGEIDYVFKMQVLVAGEEELEEFEIELPEGYVTDLSFEAKADGSLQVVGFYSHIGRGQNGVLNIVYNSNYNVETMTKKEFPLDFIFQHASEKQKKKAKKKESKGKHIELHNFTIDDLVTNEDGTVTMVAEQYYTYTTTRTDANGNTSTTTHYIYSDIILVKFNTEGEAEWMELIVKYQHGTNGGYSSGYALLEIDNGDIAIIFNDHPKNSYFETTKKITPWVDSRKNTKNTDVVLYMITTEGKTSRYILYRGGDEEVLSRPSVSAEVAQNQMVILGQAKKTTKLVKLVFE